MSFYKSKKVFTFFVFIIIFNLQFSIFNCSAQEQKISFWTPSPEYNQHRVKLLSYSLAGTYAVSMTGLYQLWYKDYPLTKFHYFDDNNEWLQYDKIGHFGSAYYVGKWGIGLYDWTGMNHKKSIWVGGSLGMIFMTSIEIFDGFSSQWGFSWGDMIANTSGYALLMSQELLWDQQRITIKFSFHTSDFAQYRPDQFGTTFPEHLFKDYNGTTTWLSGNIYSFLKQDSKFPKWLNLAVGYGVEGLTGANKNVTEYNGKPIPVFERYRQYYISPDIDLTKIKTKSKFLHTVFGVFGFLKLPAPAVEFNSIDNTKFHWLYF